MKEFSIKTSVKIFGVTSASGITYSDGVIRLISDESNFLYEHNISQNITSKLLLLDRIQNELIIKAEKLDLESLAETEDAVYAFGSGSTPKRETGFSVDKKTHAVVIIGLHHLYSSMRAFVDIDLEDFNIEGVAYDGKDWLFLNRGNGHNIRNVVIRVQGESLEAGFKLIATEFDLPLIAGLPSGFSDATIYNNKLYFIATAEAGNSTYHDGEVAGSIIGAIELDNMEIEFTEQISHHQKFEGIAFYKQDGNNISFLLCEDNDDKVLESIIYQIDINTI